MASVIPNKQTDVARTLNSDTDEQHPSESKRNAGEGGEEQKEYDLVESKRKDQGAHECEVIRGGPESLVFESDRSWRLCPKNPGHKGFIPLPKFRRKHLPCHYQSKLYDQIRLLADLTVRLRVCYTSTERPKGYPFHNHGGTKIVHMGTGMCRGFRRLYQVTQLDLPPDFLCKCHECTCNNIGNSSPKYKEWYTFHVTTAKHVVYNDEEAMSTLVDFFLDNKYSERNGKMKTAYCCGVVQSDAGTDYCILKCATHHKDLFHRLKEAYLACEGFTNENNFSSVMMLEKVDPLVVIISHPHGQPKQVSVGKATHFEADYIRWGPLTYNASTCRGSSGAPVILTSKKRRKMMNVGFHGTHSAGGEPYNTGYWMRHHYYDVFDLYVA